MPIRQLAPDVAAKIAAGEVVERPASVVKELIENSIDAGATQIRVDLVNGGLQLIRVTDNGSGIPVDELPLALARHATSKVSQIDDLEHIRSLGFRGEALASIAAVAEVTLVSHHRSAAQGAQIEAVNGQISEVTAAASPEGTIVTVRNLFSAVPARLKFLKSRNIEISHCHHLLEQYALAYPEIRFNVFSEGRQLFATAGNGQLSSVLVEVYSLQIAEQMVPIQSAKHPDNPEYPIVSGYVSRPACYKSTRQHISFFVNRRWVLSRILTSAVEKAYQTLLLTGRHPVAVINIQLDPTLLDVNVHPAKTEIRFLKEHRVFSIILQTIRSALLEEPEMPHWKSRQERQEQSLSTDSLNPVGVQFIAPSIAPSIPTIPNTPEPSNDDDELLPFPQDNPWLTVTEEETGTKPPLLSRLWQSHVRRSEPEHLEQRAAQNGAQSSEVQNIHGNAGEIALTPQRHEAALSSNNDLTGATINVPGRLPRLRVVGQLSQSYIVTEGEDGMYLIDQHAAHERILLERMVAAMKTQAPISQHLLTPINVELTPHEMEALEDHQQQLTHIGFTLEIPDGKTLLVQAVPGVLVKHMNARSLHELLIDLTAPENLGHTETWEERALANVACKAAIKANYFLTTSEMREMLEQLEQTQAPYSCCHGRPTMIHFSLSALEREFGRR